MKGQDELGNPVADEAHLRLPPPPGAESFNNEMPIRDYLSRKSWPPGFQKALIRELNMTPARFFICDDSGSMMSSDGHRLVGEGSTARLIQCSRWSEMTETLRFHVGLASAASAPTEFRLLNGAAPINVGQSSISDQTNVPTLLGLFDASPGGGTPLCHHVTQVVEQITAIAPQLKAAGKKAAVIILTDGEASDGNIAAAMRPLQHLPVWVVIRLCTDEDKMVQYWNGVDGEIELNMDVIDDPLGEAKEVHGFNSWLTYGEPLHRLREFGVTAKEMDLIDESPLTLEQMKAFCAFLFAVEVRDLPEPAIDWGIFASRINALNDRLPAVWNPISKKMTRWIDMTVLTKAYCKGGKGGNLPKGKKECIIA